MPTRDKPQKINMRVTTSQYEKRGKNNAHLLSRNLPAVKSHSTILQRLRRQISLDYYTIPPTTQAKLRVTV